MISCSPCDLRFGPLYQGSGGDAEHDDQRREQHLVAAACNLQEYAQRYKDQGGEQLVRRTEQRPDVCIADTGQNEAAQQG